jgi:hypothetical protein
MTTKAKCLNCEAEANRASDGTWIINHEQGCKEEIRNLVFDLDSSFSDLEELLAVNSYPEAVGYRMAKLRETLTKLHGEVNVS